MKPTPARAGSVLGLQERSRAAGRRPKRRNARFRLPASDLELFTRNIATQVEAGVPLLRALEVQADEHGAASAVVAGELVVALRGGVGFSEALDEFPRVFSPIYRRLVASAEVSGSLPAVLGELADFLAWREAVKSLVRKASIYPATVIVACLLLIGFILGYVFPRFAPLFQKLGNDLPVATAFLLSTGQIVARFWVELLVGAAGTVALGVLSLRSPAGARLVRIALARVPAIGPTMWSIDLARFARNLSVTSHAGVDVVHGLELTKDAVGDRRLMRGLVRAHERILGGESLTTSLAGTRLFEPMVLNMIAVGEEAGRVPEVLERLAAHYDRKAKEAVARMLALMEPAVTVILGLVVGGLAVTILGTLYKAMAVAGR
ncbi:MAG: type II secretion system F family protein [Planctomycetes bacterium]|nr:type II secretion system F family protein [Planctomycetota bacterium]MCB9889093.1 type II secretion system F family protein [Planctomycetota bacterium]